MAYGEVGSAPRGGAARRAFCGLVFASALLIGGCATSGDGPDAVNDPLEPLNRQVHAVNMAADMMVVRPVAWTYRETVPNHFKGMIRNFLNHLSLPGVLINNVLQWDWDAAGNTGARLFINSIIGFGFFDIAAAEGYEYREEDFGQTLGVWGVDGGPFLMLPLLGPSNARDTVGFVVDQVIDPLSFVQLVVVGGPELTTFGYARAGTNIVDTRARLIEPLDEVAESSLDFYVSLRSLYEQRRRQQILNEGAAGAPATPGAEDLFRQLEDLDRE